jgi:hypothetical protein
MASAAAAAYEALARVLVPVIGEVGVDALTARAVHLAGHDLPRLLPGSEPNGAVDQWSEAIASLTRQTPAVAAEAVGTVLVTFVGLLGTFIGESLTTSLLRQAWPGAFSDADGEDKV